MADKRPDLKPLESSMLDGMHYDPQTRALTVRFKGNGKTYTYDGVSLERATALEGSDSPGRYFNKEIRPHHEGRET